jgi:hypothetical protein
LYDNEINDDDDDEEDDSNKDDDYKATAPLSSYS